jgi:hypothetical protein
VSRRFDLPDRHKRDRLRQNNTTGNLRISAMRDLPVGPKQDSDPLGEVVPRSPVRHEVANWRLFIEPGVPLLQQPFELVILLMDAVGDPLLILFA